MGRQWPARGQRPWTQPCVHKCFYHNYPYHSLACDYLHTLSCFCFSFFFLMKNNCFTEFYCFFNQTSTWISHRYTYFLCADISFLITAHGVLKAGILKCFAILFSSGLHFVRTLRHDPSVLGDLHGMAHSFFELDKAVIHVISLVSSLWLWFSFCLPSDG